MKVAIMQPYFFPYIGYFQLIGAVDLFVIYDNIKYTKKGWINRNRILQGGKDVMFTLPLKSESDYLDVRNRSLADDFNRSKLLNQIRGSYGRAPHFADVFPMIESAVGYQDANLFRFLHHSLICICQHMKLSTEIRASSSIDIDHALRSEEKVIALATAVGATTYVNAIGGLDLYDKEAFREQGLDLKFIKSRPFEYRQFENAFVPWLSIIDVLMFNSLSTVRGALSDHYDML